MPKEWTQRGTLGALRSRESCQNPTDTHSVHLPRFSPGPAESQGQILFSAALAIIRYTRQGYPALRTTFTETLAYKEAEGYPWWPLLCF